jgi:acyl carrier protein
MITSTIREFVLFELVQPGNSDGLADSDSLIESGIVDSMGIISLISFLEEKFSLTIDGDDLVPENFDSIARIVSLVEARTGKDGSA